MAKPQGVSMVVCAVVAGLAGCASPPPLPTEVTNSVGMTMVLLPSGGFTMGNPATTAEMARLFPNTDPKRLQELSDERPAHPVRINRPFYMARTEVTVGQFRRFVEAAKYVPESIRDGTGGYGFNPKYDPATSRRGDAFEGRDPRYSWQNPGFAQTDAHPVVNVTWNDAVALAEWLSLTEKRTYRLPTEAEWEYACRAGTQTQYASGNEPASLARMGNVFDLDAAANWPQWQLQALPVRDGYAFTAPVGSFAPNAFGLHDMHGNVWEWVSDWHDENYYARSDADDPQGPLDGSVKVRRGGSWHTWPLYTRCSYRNWNATDTRYTLVGIRLVMEAPRQ